jgi:hypothetical protein
MSQRSSVWPGCVRKLKLVESGFDAGKLRIVQLWSIWSCEGGMSPAKPSMIPPTSEQSTARAEDVAPTNKANVSNRSPIPLPRALPPYRLSLSTSVLDPPGETLRRDGSISPWNGLDSGGPAVLGRDAL